MVALHKKRKEKKRKWRRRNKKKRACGREGKTKARAAIQTVPALTFQGP